MKKTLILFIAAALLIGAETTLTSAQNPLDNTPKVNRRQHRQNKRIHEGVKSGELTRTEAQKLKAEQDAIQAQKKAAKSDGVVTKNERKAIKQNQKAAGKDIRHQKTDSQDRSR